MTITCVVAAVDGSQGSLHALDWAADEAARRGVRLVLVHACLWERYELPELDDGDPISVRSVVEDLLALARQRAETRQPTLSVEAEVVPEETVPALLGLGRLAPLLVLGSRGHGGFAGLLLGSVSLRVAGRATYPVVIVREAAPATEQRRHGRIVLGAGPHGRDEAAAAFAVEEAGLWNAELVLVQAWAGQPYTFESVVLKQAEGSDLRVRRHSRPGNAAAALIGAGAQADLVVVGARRRHGLLGLQLGPVNHAVLHHAPCPVALLPAQ